MIDPLHMKFRRALLRWYRRYARSMPWRAASGGTPDPYHVLVSEAMLQQTQVATVVAYFDRFVAQLPTLEALAQAPEQQVLRLWQGLGYYRRARHLHRAAQKIVMEHGGAVPDTVEALLTLPGVGRYTAGAIASIAYDRSAPIVDGNVARVLARWFALTEPTGAPATRQHLWQLAAELVPQHGAGAFNQAMMDLGATVCTPRRPHCEACPVTGLCRAKLLGKVDVIPVTLPKRAPTAVTHHIVAIQRGRRYLFQQRPSNGLWANLWQLPTAEAVDAAGLRAWAKRHTGLSVGGLCSVKKFTHQTTHRTVTFELWHAGECRGRTRCGAWRSLDDLNDLPLGKPQSKAVQLLGMK